MIQSCVKSFIINGHNLFGGRYKIEVTDPQTNQIILTITKDSMSEAFDVLNELGYRVVGGCGGCRGCHGCG